MRWLARVSWLGISSEWGQLRQAVWLGSGRTGLLLSPPRPGSISINLQKKNITRQARFAATQDKGPLIYPQSSIYQLYFKLCWGGWEDTGPSCVRTWLKLEPGHTRTNIYLRKSTKGTYYHQYEVWIIHPRESQIVAEYYLFTSRE